MPLHARFRAAHALHRPRLRDRSPPRGRSVGGPGRGRPNASEARPPADKPVDHPVDHPDPEAYRTLALEVTRNATRIAAYGHADRRRGRPDHRARRPDRGVAAAARCRPRRDRPSQGRRSRSGGVHLHARASSAARSSTFPTSKTSRPGKQYAESATVTDANKIADLTRTAATLDSRLHDSQAARDDQIQQRDTLQATQSSLDDGHPRAEEAARRRRHDHRDGRLRAHRRSDRVLVRRRAAFATSSAGIPPSASSPTCSSRRARPSTFAATSRSRRRSSRPDRSGTPSTTTTPASARATAATARSRSRHRATASAARSRC